MKICLLTLSMCVFAAACGGTLPTGGVAQTQASGAGAAGDSNAPRTTADTNKTAAPASENANPPKSAASGNNSTYTSLDAKDCKTVKQTNDEGGSYVGECKGVGGYTLELLEGDLRQTINVIAPNKKKFELNLWSNVSGGFSSVGQKAEWRGAKDKPRALIVRFNASENPEDSAKITSYLVVSKITANEVCVTDVIKPSKTQNAEAQTAADKAADKPCKKFDN